MEPVVESIKKSVHHTEFQDLDGWYYLGLDRYRRQDHGGGEDGDDWLPDHEVDSDYEKGATKYKRQLETVNDILKKNGYQPNATFDLGEKGHFAIQFHLVKAKGKKAMLEDLSKGRAESYLHGIIDPLTKGVFRDEHWKPIQEIQKKLTDGNVGATLVKSGYYHAHHKNPNNPATVMPDGKEWTFDIPYGDKGGWHLTIMASFGPSTVDPETQSHKSDAYDVIYTLNWDGRMRKSSMLNEIDTLERQLIFSSIDSLERKLGMNQATVKAFLMILSGALTQYDQKEIAKEESKGGRGNIYRLGLLLKAKEEVEKEVKKYLDSDSPEAMEALKKSIEKNFHVQYIPQVRKLLKQIDAWVTEKKLPKYASVDPILQQVADVVKSSGKPMMDLRKPLESSGLFKKHEIDFTHSPFPMFTIKHKGKTIGIVNKAHSEATSDDVSVGDYVVGYL